MAGLPARARRPGRARAAGRASAPPHPPGSGDEPPGLPEELARTATAYRAWAARAGTQVAAFEADPAWTPERRFAKVLERLALPGFGRDRRFELLVTLGSAGVYPLAAGALHVGREDDPTTLAAKRLLVSGDPRLLERRAADLAAAAELPIAALDRGLAVWDTAGAADDLLATPLRRAARRPPPAPVVLPPPPP